MWAEKPELGLTILIGKLLWFNHLTEKIPFIETGRCDSYSVALSICFNLHLQVWLHDLSKNIFQVNFLQTFADVVIS